MAEHRISIGDQQDFYDFDDVDTDEDSPTFGQDKVYTDDDGNPTTDVVRALKTTSRVTFGAPLEDGDGLRKGDLTNGSLPAVVLGLDGHYWRIRINPSTHDLDFDYSSTGAASGFDNKSSIRRVDSDD